MEDESDDGGKEREIRVVLKSGERALAAFNVGACIQNKCRYKTQAIQDRDAQLENMNISLWQVTYISSHPSSKSRL